MSTHIEWLNANAVAVTGIAHPGEFVNDDSENDVACVVITSSFNGDGVCIQGRPDDLGALAHRILNAVNGIASDTNADPELRALYGMVSQ